MYVYELIDILKKYPPHLEVWKYNEGASTLGLWFKPVKNGVSERLIKTGDDPYISGYKSTTAITDSKKGDVRVVIR